jgi:hypothetical protein
VVILAHIRGADWQPFDKRDVVVTDQGGKQELYREGPFTSGSAARRQQLIAREITADGLAAFLRRRQIEESTIGRVSAPTGRPTGAEEAAPSVRLWWDRLRGSR